VELLVALSLLGVVGVIATGLIVPLRLTSRTGSQSQALSYARSYLELVKARWADPTAYAAAVQPTTADTTGANGKPADIRVPGSWTVKAEITSDTGAPWTADDALRRVSVTVSPSGSGTTPVRLTTLVAQP
jgi:type II secretory pathway pseudopilin PulG